MPGWYTLYDLSKTLLLYTQDTYATDLFSFLSRERELADLLHKVYDIFFF